MPHKGAVQVKQRDKTSSALFTCILHWWDTKQEQPPAASALRETQPLVERIKCLSCLTLGLLWLLCISSLNPLVKHQHSFRVQALAVRESIREA